MAVRGLIDSLRKKNYLATQLARREILGRYKGSRFGLVWSILQPLIMLGVYTLFFTQVFKARWGQGDAGTGTYAVALFVGIVIHGFVAESVSKGANCVVANPSLVKKVVFPLAVLPWSVVLSALFHGLIGVLVIVAAWAALGHGISTSVLVWPLMLIPITLVCSTFAYITAALNVYFRDVGQVTGLMMTALLFTSPVFFHADQVSGKMQQLLSINPLTYLIEESRSLLMFSGRLDVAQFLTFCLLSVLAFAGAKWFFGRVSAGFADVL